MRATTGEVRMTNGDGVGDEAQLAPVSRECLDQLGQASTATITTRLFALGLRNTFLGGVQPLGTGRARMVGEAFTLRYIPAREDVDVLDVFADYDHPQRKAIESVGPGQVLVVDSREDGRAASAGEILLTRLMTRGAAGFVTDGSVRDVAGIRALAMPVFVAGTSAMTNLALHHAVDMQVPIGCANVPVYPGDILVGDTDGVVCVPRHLAERIAHPAVEQDRLEAFLLEQVATGRALRGVYPPNQETTSLYLASQDGNGDEP